MLEDRGSGSTWLHALARNSVEVAGAAAVLLPALLLADACVDDGVSRWRAYPAAAALAVLAVIALQLALEAALAPSLAIVALGPRERAGYVMSSLLHWIVAIVALHAGLRNSIEATARFAGLQVSRARQRRWLMEQRLSALQARIDPAFLLQAMRRIGHLHDVGPPRAIRALDDLVEWLRAATPTATGSRPSGMAELALATRYLELRRALAPEGAFDFSLAVSAPDPTRPEVAIPPMLLMPLIELALGDSNPADTRAHVDVQAGVDDSGSRLAITVRPAARADPAWHHARDTSLRERILALFGDRALLRAELAPGANRLSLEWPHEPSDRHPR